MRPITRSKTNKIKQAFIGIIQDIQAKTGFNTSTTDELVSINVIHIKKKDHYQA